MTGVIEGSIFGAASRDEQVAALTALGGVANGELADARKAYRAFLRAGYGSSFVAVKDLAAQIAALQGLLRARSTKDVAAVPALYVRLDHADDQFAQDSQYLCFT